MARKLPIAIAVITLIAALFAGSAQARRLSTLVAPPSACPNQTDLRDPAVVQERAMHCMTDFARAHDGLGALANAADLDRSAQKKSTDIVRCDSFSHEACGRQFTYWMQRSGYLAARCWRAGENIAWGTGNLASVRSIFVAWLHSPEHRANLLGRYSSIGIALRIGNLEGHRGAHVWTQDFGSHCGTTTRRHHRTPRIPAIHLGLRTAFRAH
jgi:Cysteine-rich secretory protein family